MTKKQELFLTLVVAISIGFIVGALTASFITFVIGLFVDYPFTLWNVTKVFLAQAALSMLLGGIRRS